MKNNLLSKSQVYLKKNAPTILTYVGGVGVITTTITAIKATPKAMRLLEAAKNEKRDELTKLEKAKIVGPVYIPTAVLASTTIACIFGANILNKRHQASLMSAYALIDNSYKEYKKKVEELYGEDGNQKVIEEIAEDKIEEAPNLEEEELLFYDEFSGRFFKSTMYNILSAQYQINREISMKLCATVNEYYDLLGIPHVDGGDFIGWSSEMNYQAYWQEWIDFSNRKAVMDDGTEYYIITMFQEPMTGFDDY